jgi:hypothetical protein
MPYRSPDSQTQQNIIREEVKAFGDVGATFDTFIDLSTAYPNYVYSHLIVVNSLDEDVKITIGDNELTIKAFKDLWMDGLRYLGEIQLKYVSDAPTEGDIQIICY